MRRFLFAAFAGASLLMSPVAFADDTRPVSPTPVAAASDDKLVCKAVTHEGQLVGEMCQSQKEWDRMRYEQQQWLREYQQ